MLLASGGVQEVLGPPRPSPRGVLRPYLAIRGSDFDLHKPNLTVLKEEFVSPDPLQGPGDPPRRVTFTPSGGESVYGNQVDLVLEFPLGFPVPRGVP